VRLRLRRIEAAAQQSAEAMCRKLLANPVTEDFEIVLPEGRVRCVRDRHVSRLQLRLRLLQGAHRRARREAYFVWHREERLGDCDLVVLPGGFSYGDYLRAGAIARFSPIMADVQRFAADGGHVLGICNGFQVLCEAHMLPGALVRNRSLQFQGERVWVRVENNDTAFTRRYEPGQVLHLHIAHGQGNYVADPTRLARSRRRPRGVPLRRRARRADGRRQRERLDEQHRRHHQRGRQRARPDAAPGAFGRALLGSTTACRCSSRWLA
jgi:GMP synthase-like glutamine amidotransferase